MRTGNSFARTGNSFGAIHWKTGNFAGFAGTLLKPISSIPIMLLAHASPPKTKALAKLSAP
jgi:hypothetical protein